MSSPRTLFIGLGTSAACWYRCSLPGIYLGKDADWIGIAKSPKQNLNLGGSIERIKNVEQYDVIVCQQPSGDDWLKCIDEWQSKGIKVVFECDDFLHGVHKVKNHRYQKQFNKKKIKEFETCMKACDAMICSTEFLSEQYKKYNANQHVCLVGIDTKRYNIKFPDREWITIGWAGGTGHELALIPWLEVINRIMKRNSKVAFSTIGVDYAKLMSHYHPHRCLSIPWVSIENLPYVITNFDIAIAPAHESKYHLAKSDLRWLEAGALGLPVVADSRIYKDIENGVTGYSVDGSLQERNRMEEVEDELELLIYSESDRRKIGESAKSYIANHRDINQAVDQWVDALNSIVK